MASFDLIESPWIPVIEGGERREVGLREALVRAHAFREITDPSPLVVVSLHRLLLALIHRAVNGPADEVAWAELWEAGALPAEAVNSYLDAWRERFDLFHPQRPFYGTAEVGVEYGMPVQNIVFD